MPLESLHITQLRNLCDVKMTFSSGLNVIAGPNASGKTSLFEAIALLCQGRSFRTPRVDQLIQHKQTGLTVVGRIRTSHRTLTLGMARADKKTQVKLDGSLIPRTTELIDVMPVHVITPESHEILDQGPKMRRQYLDWGVFHVKQAYLTCWQRYHRILRQRNHTLRSGANPQAIRAWDGPLVTEATQLHNYRVSYLTELTPVLHQYGQTLLEMAVDFMYRPGWSKEAGNYAEQLQLDFVKDQEHGFTHSGPHRADISLRVDGMPIKSVFSRGQQKLLICAMYLAQVAQAPKPGILLIDDLPAELDPAKRAKLLAAAASTGAQVFVSTTEASLIPMNGWGEKKVFHVEHGEFHEVV